ncbi:A/G-specific DNA-adenine glycosylase [Marinococcus luteus]|uniref:A/G-specific DNA-adenine glycosylase n=1 Tax=Marinococcus luteus TaxID=1122204 RepID=A0A1H2QI77_9BACI|nr:hypothetical protein [Marinococcus luteus]SDW06119.1 A/G-specific DNA-adenine glycosylase [Marinococcus luteus]
MQPTEWNAPSEPQLTSFRSLLIEWGEKHFAPFPWRYTANAWHALVAEMMLQRTNANQVEQAYNDFVQKYPSPGDYLQDEQARVFHTLGLTWRENVLRDLAAQLMEKGIPEERKELLQLRGVGAYIAAAYRSLHLGYRDVIIDSNVVRLYGRVFGFATDAETRRKKWFIDLADHLTPNTDYQTFNYALLDFTRAICTPRPNCTSCPLTTICIYYQEQKHDT